MSKLYGSKPYQELKEKWKEWGNQSEEGRKWDKRRNFGLGETNEWLKELEDNIEDAVSGLSSGRPISEKEVMKTACNIAMEKREKDRGTFEEKVGEIGSKKAGLAIAIRNSEVTENRGEALKIVEDVEDYFLIIDETDDKSFKEKLSHYFDISTKYETVKGVDMTTKAYDIAEELGRKCKELKEAGREYNTPPTSERIENAVMEDSFTPTWKSLEALSNLFPEDGNNEEYNQKGREYSEV